MNLDCITFLMVKHRYFGTATDSHDPAACTVMAAANSPHPQSIFSAMHLVEPD